MAKSLSLPEDEWTINCILCKQPLDVSVVTVKLKGIQTLIESSKVRGDPEVQKVLSKRNDVQVHRSCSKSYNSKENLKYISIVNKPEKGAGLSTRKSNTEFDFKNNCLYCGDILNKSRMIISQVTSVKLRENLLKKYSHLEDAEAKRFINRISLVPCLVEAAASYHRKCQSHPPFEKSRVKVSDLASKNDVTQLVIDYLTDKPNEVQCSVNDILSIHKDIDNRPNLAYLKYVLQETFGCEFIIQISKDDIIISKMSFAKLLLADNFVKSKLESSENEKLKTVDDSSAIIHKDILKMQYDLDYYPPQDQFLKDSDLLVPDSLRRYLSNIISKNKAKPDDWKDLINSIAHTIIAATRPKLFVSPVLVNVASVLHRMYGSKELIQLLHANGFSASYEEVRRYISSVVSQEQQHAYGDQAFTQIVYDNADHNVGTSDGRNTFHVMGGIQITTPKSAVSESERVKRLRDPLTAEELSKIGKIELKPFHKNKEEDDCDGCIDEDENDSVNCDGCTVVYRKPVTLFAKKEGEASTWSYLGRGKLEVVYDEDIFGALIYVENEKKDVISNTLISIDTMMQCVDNECVWTATDSGCDYDPRMKRTLKAVFSTAMNATKLYKAFLEAGKSAKIANIRDSIELKINYPTKL